MPDPVGSDLHGKTYWLVGASEGFGQAIAEALRAEGARLVLSARSGDKLRKMAAELGQSRALPVDVTDMESVRAAVAEAGDVDGIIWCVGYYDPMTAQDWDADAAVKMVDTNLSGAMRLFGMTVPAMARRGAGHVVIIGSVAGYRGLPGAIGYAAAKGALQHLAEDMYIDLKGTGVCVQLANPGFIRTRLSGKNDFNMPQLMEPEDAAGHVVKLMKSGRFRRDFPHPFAWVFSLGRFLPMRWFARLMGA